MADLSPLQLDALSKALKSAMNSDTLQKAVFVSTGDHLYKDYVGEGRPLGPTIDALLNALEEQGTTAIFLTYVYANWPNRSDLRKIIASNCPEAAADTNISITKISAQQAGQLQPDQPPSARAPGFERNIRPHIGKVDVRVWLEQLTRIEGQVCRIDHKGNACGTGFLVGPQVVLTNWHVVEAIAEPSALAEVTCRFDYVRLQNGSRVDGPAIALAPGQCLLDHSPYGRLESEDVHEPPPGPDELDYALLKLATPIGSDTDRKWITLPAAPAMPKEGAPLLIVQHPDGNPMMLALDTNAVIRTNANGTRIRYATNTEAGSSGSPCFTMDWDLIALHHYGDPAWANPSFNQGVPIGLIRSLIGSRGFGDMLGG